MFIDSNILINAVNPKSDHHEPAKTKLHDIKNSFLPLFISGQMIREFFSTLTRPGNANGVGLPTRQAVSALNGLLGQIDTLDDTPAVRTKLIALVMMHDVKGKQIHDANIVATMLVHGERQLLTFNGGDFARYRDVIEVVAP
jgi:predicted nucleic acid-binding protein